MTSSRVDPILDLLDAALEPDDRQDSPEAHIYSDVAPALPDAGTCWRCTTNPTAEGSELCAGCRAFLLEDSDHDPADPAKPPRNPRGRYHDGQPITAATALELAPIGQHISSEVLARHGITHPGPDWVYEPARDWWTRIDPTEPLDARGRTYDEIARPGIAGGQPITIIANAASEVSDAWVNVIGRLRSGDIVAISNPGGNDSVAFRILDERYQAERTAREFDVAVQRLADALGTTIDELETVFRRSMVAVGWAAEELSETLIRLFGAQPPTELSHLGTIDDETAADEPLAEPRNRAERRAERFSHHAATAQPGPRPAWTHRLNDR